MKHRVVSSIGVTLVLLAIIAGCTVTGIVKNENYQERYLTCVEAGGSWDQSSWDCSQ